MDFFNADIRDFNLNKKFDVVVAMFAVMSYQTTNKDIENTLKSINNHLNPGGLFIFDVWFGPAVLMQKPADMVKNVKHGDKKIIRYAHPILDRASGSISKHPLIANSAVNSAHFPHNFCYSHLKPI